MTDHSPSPRVQTALELHNKGYNCAQAVSCAFCDLTGIDEKTMFRMTEGLGLGMGGMEGTCGAISSAAILSGFKLSTCNLEKPNSKAVTYHAAKECMAEFKKKNGSIICKDLKGIETKKPLRSCSGCIKDAVEIIEKHLMNRLD